jgi:flagellar basal body P-ring protein FlgI
MTQIVNENETTELTEDQVRNMITAHGINYCINSYDKDIKNLVANFVSLDLKEFSPLWDYINDSVKLKIIAAHSVEFKEWLNNTK